MKRMIVAFLCGAVFAVGLGISGMTHPLKVLGFLDFFGDWDPSLAFVMGSGVIVSMVFFAIARRRGAPLFAPSFSLPTATKVDAPLVIGAAIFGIGWGLGGFCPGPAVVSVVAGATPVIAFVLAMVAGMSVFDALTSRARARALQMAQLLVVVAANSSNFKKNV